MNVEVDEKGLDRALEQMNYVLLQAQHGDSGMIAFRSLLTALHQIYRFIEPTWIKASLVVFQALDDSEEPISITGSVVMEQAASLRNEVGKPCVVRILPGGRFRVWKDASFDTKQIAQHAVVYSYKNLVERFYAKDQERRVEKIFLPCESMFAVPAFISLKDAIERYGVDIARHTSCEILRGIWHDSDRIFLKGAKEYVMRKSLTQYLKNVFRDAEVRPEQNVDESHPIDIKVTWSLSNRLALIEIKWLGRSKSKGKLGTSYSNSRANEGAKQLADYLDSNLVQAPAHITRGYLVVFDGRRRGLKANTRKLDKKNGMHFRNEDLTFSKKYHEIREDFETPFRLFLEPICR